MHVSLIDDNDFGVVVHFGVTLCWPGVLSRVHLTFFPHGIRDGLQKSLTKSKSLTQTWTKARIDSRLVHFIGLHLNQCRFCIKCYEELL